MAPPSRLGIPVASGALPGIGHLPKLLFSLREFFHQQSRELGPIFWINRGFGDHALFTGKDPDRTILANRRTSSTDALETTEMVLGGTMLVTDGPEHRRIRGAWARAFSPKGLSMAKTAVLTGGVLERRVASWKQMRKVPIVKESRAAAIDAIFQILGVPKEDAIACEKKYADYALGFIRLPIEFPGSPRWRSRRAKQWLNAYLRDLIERFSNHDPSSGLVAALAQASDEDGRGLNPDELVRNLRVLFLAGHDTTATAFSWIGFYLASDPDLWARMCQEIGPDSEVPTSREALATFPLAAGLFREVVRLHPPIAMISRKVSTELQLHGYTIPVGTSLALCISHFSRDPERYANPDVLQPERWLNKKLRPGSAETASFGAGPHFCLGYHLALLEGTQFVVAVVSALQRWGKRFAHNELPRAMEYPIARPSKRAFLRLVDA